MRSRPPDASTWPPASPATSRHRRLRLLCAAGIAAGAAVPSVQAEGLRPTSFFAQVGAGKAKTQAATVGLTWDWRWRRDTRFGALGGYWEAALGHWFTDRDDPDTTRHVTQIGFTPVLRWYPTAWGETGFAELGIGVNAIAPRYRSGRKQFSTVFNFGDHLALGMRFGAALRHEVAVRVQHFSNGDLRKPNPGEDFVQLRYSMRF